MIESETSILDTFCVCLCVGWGLWFGSGLDAPGHGGGGVVVASDNDVS